MTEICECGYLEECHPVESYDCNENLEIVCKKFKPKTDEEIAKEIVDNALAMAKKKTEFKLSDKEIIIPGRLLGYYSELDIKEFIKRKEELVNLLHVKQISYKEYWERSLKLTGDLGEGSLLGDNKKWRSI